MTSNMHLLVGLGNPGQEYELSRHNAGRITLDYLVKEFGGIWQSDKKHHCMVSTIVIEDHKFLCVKTLDYYNTTGKTINDLCKYYKIPFHQLIVIHDEIDLPTENIKLKVGGGHGGNNGLKSIELYCKTLEFGRIRIGVDRPQYGDVVDRVLGKRPDTGKDWVFSNFSQVTTKIIQYCINESKKFVRP